MTNQLNEGSTDRMSSAMQPDRSTTESEIPSGDRFATPDTADSTPLTDPDPQLVQETRMQIRGLVQEISELAQSGCELDEFLEGFLNRVVGALAAAGAAIWMRSNDELELAYAINLPESLKQSSGEETDESISRHDHLIRRLIQNGEPVLVPPQTRMGSSESVTEEGPGNPTPFLLVIAPIRVDQETIGLVEIFQRSGSGPTTQRGYLRFLVQMCSLASDFFKSSRLKGYSDRQEHWERLEQFIHLIHGSLDLRETSFHIANEGRRVLQCERLSIAVAKNDSLTIQSVSGLDTIDRRAADLKLLTKLARSIATTREPLVYNGSLEAIPPQIEKTLEQYVDRTHCKWMAIVPVIPSSESSSSSSNRGTSANEGDPVGVIVVEQLSDTSRVDDILHELTPLAQHAADALVNVKTHAEIPFARFWRWLNKLAWFGHLRQLPATIALTSLIVGSIVALVIVPADFEMSADGQLTPTIKNRIFAPMDAKVVKTNFPTDPQQTVKPGHLLLVLENRPLEAEIRDLEGRELRLIAEYDSLRRAIIEQNSQLSPIDAIKLETDLVEVEESLATVRQTLDIRKEELSSLSIYADRSGIIGDWQAEERLQFRPVQRGQTLLTLVDPKSEWELELEIPEKRVGHIVAAQNRSDDPLVVTFVLASDPARQFQGKLKHVHLAAEVREGDQNVVLIRVAIDKQAVPSDLLRHGTRLRARIDCGTRSLGYVLFHDVIETVQKHVLFWF